MLDLLLINIPEEYTPAIINTFSSLPDGADYLTFDDPHQIQQKLIDNSYWDAIILSESSLSFPLLKSVVNNFDDTPVIFFSEAISEQLFTKAIDNGALDCVASNNLYRIPQILKREITKDRTDKAFKFPATSPKALSDIINRSTDEILLFDIESLRCSFVNKTAENSLGYSEKELQEKTPRDIYSEYTSDSFESLIAPLLKSQRNQITMCTNIRRKKGVVYPTKVQLTIISFKNKSCLLAINKDISDTWYKVRKLKRERARAKSFIKKHKQKQELLANAAHDMRTSLQSIILSNKLLFDKQSGDFQKGFSKFQKAIHFSGKHLLNYINEFFDPSGDTPTLPNSTSESLDIKSFARKLFLVFKPIAQRNEIDFQLQVSELSHQHIPTNKTYVKRILKNFLSNAFKFTNQGSVTFSVYTIQAQNMNGRFADTKDLIAFEVQDTGIGIPEDQQKSIFGRHNRTENKKNGSGLGLHICRKLTESIGGKIEVSSDLGKGTTFTLYLPAQKITSAALPNSSTNNGGFEYTNAIQNQNKEILIIDDSEVHNLALKEYLNYTFDTCITASSLSKAKEIVDEHNIDCIVSDYTIYEDNCLSFLQEINDEQRFKDIIAIVYTGKKLTQAEKKSISHYSDSLVRKKAGSYEELSNTILSLFHENSNIGPQTTE